MSATPRASMLRLRAAAVAATVALLASAAAAAATSEAPDRPYVASGWAAPEAALEAPDRPYVASGWAAPEAALEAARTLLRSLPRRLEGNGSVGDDAAAAPNASAGDGTTTQADDGIEQHDLEAGRGDESSGDGDGDGDGGDGDDDDVIIVIACASVGGAVLLLLILGAALGYMWKVRSEVRRQHEAVFYLELLEEDYEARKEGAKSDIEMYISRVDANRSHRAGELADRHAVFVSAWTKFREDSRNFLEKEYTPCLRLRRSRTAMQYEPSRKVNVSGPKVYKQASGPKGSAVSPPPTSASPDEPSRCCGGGGFSPPLTPPKEVSRQMQAIQSLDGRLDALVVEFLALEEETFPSGTTSTNPVFAADAAAQGEAPPLASRGSAGTIGTAGTGRASWHSARDERLEGEVDALRAFMHPLLTRVVVKPYGVLGAAQGEKDPKPGSSIDAVVVDPAGWPFIGRANNPRGAAGASCSIYTWLEMGKGPEVRFPPPVNDHFNTWSEADAETRAKFHVYSTGQYVLHAIGPKVSSVAEGMAHLSHTYANILTEFCQAISGNSKVPRVLRLLPVSSGVFLRNKRLEAHMPQLTSSAISVACAMLPPAMQDILAGSTIELCIFLGKDQKEYQQVFDAKASESAGVLRLPADMGAVAPRYSGFDWVRTKNGPQDRLERIGALLMTQRALRPGGYRLPDADRAIGNDRGGEVTFDMKETLRATRIVRSPERLAAKSSSRSTETEVVSEDRLTVMEAATLAAAKTSSVVAVNAASAFHVGGGVLTGGRHALEETWCTISTLLPSLQQAKWQLEANMSSEQLAAADVGGFGPMHVPVDGCIVSPEVVIFRETSAKGYAFQAKATRLAGVCSVAMFNMNPRVSDSPVDAPRDFEGYCRCIKQKFRAVVVGAVELQAEVLVCPDVGCGVFENDPQVVGTMFGEVLRELPGVVPKVILTGKSAFARAVKAALAGLPPQPALQPSRYFGGSITDQYDCYQGHPPGSTVVVAATPIGSGAGGEGHATGHVVQDAPASAGAGAGGGGSRQVAATTIGAAAPSAAVSSTEPLAGGGAAGAEAPPSAAAGKAVSPRKGKKKANSSGSCCLCAGGGASVDQASSPKTGSSGNSGPPKKRTKTDSSGASTLASPNEKSDANKTAKAWGPA